MGDEFFNVTKKWVLDFCDALEASKLNIFYKIAGARVSQMDKDTLIRLRQTGCFEIDYGFESGSDKILREYGKGVTRQQNIQAAKEAAEVGISAPVQLVIGSPGEDDLTIQETISMLRETNTYAISLNYLIALPQTPIWKYCQEKKLIPDWEGHLRQVADLGGLFYLNLTPFPYLKVMGWRMKIISEVEAEYALHQGNIIMYQVHKIFSCLYSNMAYLNFREKLRQVYKAVKLDKIRHRLIRSKSTYNYIRNNHAVATN